MNRHTATRGATLVVVVLFTSLLLAVLLAASSQLTLSSRRTVSDQRAALQAQYVAESGVALARSRIRDVQAILAADNLVIPNGTTANTIRSYAERYCGNTTWAAEGTTRTCTYQSSTAADQFEVFAQFVSDAAYTRLPSSERPTTVAAKRTFWKNMLGAMQQVQTGGVTLNYRLVPTRAERLNNSSYRFHLRLDTLTTKGEQTGAVRVLKANRSNLTNWWVDISLPSYLDNVLFTNHHTSEPDDDDNTWSPTVNFTNQVFDGPVHTNERFLFTSGATANFKGSLSSAGCTNLPKTGMNSGGGCTSAPGFFSSDLKTPSSSSTTDELKNANLLAQLDAATDVTLAQVKNSDGTLSEQRDVTFTGDYRPMPINANSQRAAAQGVAPSTDVTTDTEEIARYTAGRGLYFGNEVLGVTLSAGDANGSLPTTVSGDPKKWTPTPTHQHISVLRGYVSVKTGTQTVCLQRDRRGNCTLYGTQDIYASVAQYDYYRADANGKLEQKSLLGTWAVVPDPASPANPRPFNGTIFGEKAIKNLSGPARYNSNLPAQPAIAPFSQITVASEDDDIEISGDLTLSDESCTKDLAACTDAGVEPPKNVLGVFTQKGNVVIGKDAPNNVNIQAMLMSSEGEVTVADYDDKDVGPRGTVNPVGGLVENWYGAFGTFSGTTSVSGYGRNFSHDRRFENPGLTPPFFPVSPVWIKEDGSEEGLKLEEFLVQQGNKADLP